MTTAQPDVAIPAPTVTQEEINEWYTLQKQLGEMSFKEMALRKKIFGALFIAPKEGVNTVPLAEGWVMKGDYKINRKVDVASLTTLSPMLKEKGIPVDSLIRYKPDLATKEYRDLQKNPELCKLFEQVLVITVGSPALEIVLPKRAS